MGWVWSSCGVLHDTLLFSRSMWPSAGSSLYQGVLDGRRIVELGYLAEQLDKGCAACEHQLRLTDCIEERRYGLASLLDLSCQQCHTTTTLKTSKTPFTRNTGRCCGRPAYDVNTRSSPGVISAGLGMTQANKFLATMDVPPISLKSLNVREREIGPAVEKLAKSSCEHACSEERQLTISSSQSSAIVEGSAEDEATAVPITGSYDCGWTKRGRAMNSITGTGALIGLHNKKVLAYASRQKKCRTCEHSKKKGMAPPVHDCRMNWNQSSKAMEPDIAVQVAKEIRKNQVSLGALIADDDASTIKRIREEVDVDVDKWADLSHTNKNFLSRLEEAKSTHKELKNAKVTAYLGKCFMYGIKKNVGNAAGIRQSLRNVPKHVFGEHGTCGEWCKAKNLEDPSTYTFKELPRGKPLESPELQTFLESVFEKYASSAEKPAQCGSSNPSEALNQTFSTVAPKRLYYGDSESYSFRIACGVASHNEGSMFIPKVLKEAGLSGGKHTQTYAHRSDEVKKQHAKRKGSVDFKRRRYELRTERKARQSSQEVKEGTTYRSGCAVDDMVVDNEVIPSLITLLKPVAVNSLKPIVVFDLETTDLSSTAQVTQIAACCFGKPDLKFDAYCLPEKPISAEASKITGISIVRESGEQVIYQGENRVMAKPWQRVEEMFGEWLQTNAPSSILLGHKCLSYDARVLCHVSSDSFLASLSGFADSLPALRSALPGRESYTLASLQADLCSDVEFLAHNAASDVDILSKVMAKAKIDVNAVLQHSETTTSFLSRQKQKHESKDREGTFAAAVQAKAMSKSMAKKAAGSGLCFHHIRLSFQRNALDGVFSLLSDKSGGSAQVSSRRKISESLAEYCQSLNA